MSASSPLAVAEPAVGRGVRATWWYTFSSAVFFALGTLTVWAIPTWATASAAERVVFVAASVAWLVAFVMTGLDYFRADAAGRRRWVRFAAFALGAAAAIAIAFVTGGITLALALVGALVCTLPWPPGVRARVTGLVTVVLAAVAVIEYLRAVEGEATLVYGPIFVLFMFPVALPITVVSMLWWWDIVRELDRARLTEAKLAATQERLRLASDVHDLQGHHLQVVALQLELAERLSADPPAALAHIRAARREVDEARVGTRALAARFRGVPLPDELANAADLLRAAGLDVELAVSADAAGAPSGTLGPVVRESTTNILKHGGGRFARLSLERDATGWRYRAENDRGHAAVGRGAGIDGMTARLAEAQGALVTELDGDVFVLDVRVPTGAGA
ncbi:histidine kinase [Microbacterium sp. BG28]|uniref:sensor histidine kinase n=1 Tax=Microbacterium sp. BG28 TaxID=3097356 RepID=UPI002A59D668|nr:histidine kinase [Microbacterium sp. BG28]MDY0829703.1 histidine kinase [Microbacterium sp. BG28]